MPSRFREVLSPDGDSRIVMTADVLEPCVLVYPLHEWQRMEERFAAQPQFDEGIAKIRRRVIGEAAETEVDKLGRVLIAPALREHAGLRRDVVWAGVGLYIELWDKQRWEDHRRAVLDDPDQRRAIAAQLSARGV